MGSRNSTHSATLTGLLGIYIYTYIERDFINLQLQFPKDKLLKLEALLKTFVPKRKASKRELQKLAGNLHHSESGIYFK